MKTYSNSSPNLSVAHRASMTRAAAKTAGKAAPVPIRKSTKTRTWESNAKDFALLSKGEGWPFAILVACSVERGLGWGGDPKTRSIRSSDRMDGKVSAQEFADKAGTTHNRVLRFLDAWDAAAFAGQCSPSGALSPADAEHIGHPEGDWSKHYAAVNAAARAAERAKKEADAAAAQKKREEDAAARAALASEIENDEDQEDLDEIHDKMESVASAVSEVSSALAEGDFSDVNAHVRAASVTIGKLIKRGELDLTPQRRADLLDALDKHEMICSILRHKIAGTTDTAMDAELEKILNG